MYANSVFYQGRLNLVRFIHKGNKRRDGGGVEMHGGYRLILLVIKTQTIRSNTIESFRNEILAACQPGKKT